MANSLYEHWSKMDKWLLHDSINLLVQYELVSQGITDSKTYFDLKAYTCTSYERMLKLHLNIPSDDLNVDFNKSFAPSKSIIKWASSEGIRIPEEFMNLLVKGIEDETDDFNIEIDDEIWVYR